MRGEGRGGGRGRGGESLICRRMEVDPLMELPPEQNIEIVPKC